VEFFIFDTNTLLSAVFNESSTPALPIQFFEKVAVCRDANDDKYLSLAKASQADCIISGDQDLLVLNPFENIPILNAADFLERLKTV
jgi:putative PIN family toxin of toxin-antitoxin system